MQVHVRRSKRKRREGWRQTLDLSIRTSRARGDGDVFEVKSRGGQPSHKRGQTLARLPFCSSCGFGFGDDTQNFCPSCGTKRATKATSTTATESPPQILDTATESSAPSTEARGAEKQTCASKEQPASAEKQSCAEQSSSVTAKKNTVANRRGRKNLKVRLRCGWVVVEGQSYTAPDGTTFANRKEASQYHNKNVAKLEPQRQDGWGVYISESGSHQDWRAPDGEVLHSYAAAKTYAAKAGLKIYGRDGISTSIFSFFSSNSNGTTERMHAQKETQAEKAIDLTVHPPQKQVPVPAPEQTPAPAPASRPARIFKVPIQNSRGQAFQKLCRKAAILRNKRRQVAKDMQETRHEYDEFIVPRLVSNAHLNRVIC